MQAISKIGIIKLGGTALLLMFFFCACRMPGSRTTQTAKLTADTTVPLISIPPGTVPLLETNRVLKIAQEAATARKYNLSNYICDAMVFQGDAFDQGAAKSWMVHFVTHRRAPDLDFFVFINDSTGTAELWHR